VLKEGVGVWRAVLGPEVGIEDGIASAEMRAGDCDSVLALSGCRIDIVLVLSALSSRLSLISLHHL